VCTITIKVYGDRGGSELGKALDKEVQKNCTFKKLRTVYGDSIVLKTINLRHL
jgi:hypothetical protein